MAELDIPTFTRGEHSFAAKLNQLGAAILGLANQLELLQEEVKALAEAHEKSAPKAPATRKATASKAE